MAAKKTLYHSEAVTLGAIVATIKSKALKSKYAGKPDYVELVIDGNSRQYMVENQNCADFFNGRVGQTLTIEFKDSRESATVHAMSAAQGGSQAAAQNPPADQAPARTEQRRGPTPHDTRKTQSLSEYQNQQASAQAKPAQPATGTRKPDLVDAVIDARGMLARCGNGIRMAADESLRVIEGFCVEHGLPWNPEIKSNYAHAVAEEMTKTTFTTLFIRIEKAGLTDRLPKSNLEKHIEAARQRLADSAKK